MLENGLVQDGDTPAMFVFDMYGGPDAEEIHEEEIDTYDLPCDRVPALAHFVDAQRQKIQREAQQKEHEESLAADASAAGMEGMQKLQKADAEWTGPEQQFEEDSTVIPHVTYRYAQRSFDPQTRMTLITVSFAYSDGSIHRNAFRYYWRLYRFKEVRAMLLDVGFCT